MRRSSRAPTTAWADASRGSFAVGAALPPVYSEVLVNKLLTFDPPRHEGALLGSEITELSVLCRAIRHELLDFFVRISVTASSQVSPEAYDADLVPTALAAVAPTVIMQSCLPQLEFGDDTTIASVNLSDQRAISETRPS